MECIQVFVLSHIPQFRRNMEHLLSSKKDIIAWGMDKLKDEFINESIIGTIFRGRLVSEVSVGNVKAAIPEITASASAIMLIP